MRPKVSPTQRWVVLRFLSHASSRNGGFFRVCIRFAGELFRRAIAERTVRMMCVVIDAPSSSLAARVVE